MTRDEVFRIIKEAREKGDRPDLCGADLRGADLRGVDPHRPTLPGDAAEADDEVEPGGGCEAGERRGDAAEVAQAALRNVGWRELAGAAALCGIGGGMSLGWAVLAGSPLAAETRTAILAASLLSALAGYGLLRHVLAQRRNKVLQRI